MTGCHECVQVNVGFAQDGRLKLLGEAGFVELDMIAFFAMELTHRFQSESQRFLF